jgi:hypothetical protein
LIAPVLVLFSGGLGWWHLLKDARWGEQSVFDILLNLQQQYTITPDTGYRWGNSITTLLIPQRGILLGFPLALIVFTAWWTSLDKGEEGKGEGKSKKAKGKRKAESPLNKQTSNQQAFSTTRFPFNFLGLPSVRRMALAGALAGLLPLIHAHSFVVVMVVGAGVALLTGLKDWRAWGAFFAVATIIAAPQMWWVTRGSAVSAGDFFGWHWWWESGEENVFKFWLKNTGLLIPLIFAALLWRRGKKEGEKLLVPRRLLLFYLPFTLCFIIPNMIKLAPWVWDNIKVIFYWFIASTPLVALLLARMMREGKWPLRAVSIGLLLVLTLSGMLDVWSVASRAGEFRIFDADGVRFAQMVKRETRPRATILHEPTFDTPIFLTGRRSVMGYPGHVSSHGIEYLGRLAEIRRIYAGAPDAESLLKKYGVEYVVAGPHEQREAVVNESFFAGFQLVGEIGPFQPSQRQSPNRRRLLEYRRAPG